MKKFLVSAASTLVALSLAAPAFAAEVEVDASVKAEVRAQVTARDLACMQTAIEKRENAIIAGLENYTLAWKTSLQTRRDELRAAWGMTDKDARRNAVNAAWKKFRESRVTQRRAFKEARKNAWKQFRTDSKACKVTNTETGGEALDAQN